jgi:hypothetical protein
MTLLHRSVKFCRAASIAVAFFVAFGFAPLHAQISSSADYHLLADPDASASPDAAPASHGSNRPVPPYRYPYAPRLMSHLAAEFGGGLTTPANEDQHDLTYGWNVVAGAGYKFSREFSLMGEYQFNSNKIPAKILAQVGEPGGNVHIWSLTLDPVLNVRLSNSAAAYITGGGGFYRKTTSFTEPATITSYYCDYFYCYPYQYQGNVVVSRFSTDQGGVNLGGGLTFGNWDGGKFYTEARYTWIDTPGRATRIVPLTFGFRW